LENILQYSQESPSQFQIFIREEPEGFGPTTSRNLGRKIIISLAYSDLLAAVGIFVRSALWRFIYLTPAEDDTHSILFCSLSSVSLVTIKIIYYMLFDTFKHDL
jgi:hypothetical protein